MAARPVQPRLVVVSIDGLSVRELDSLRGLARFSAFMAKGAAPVELRSVYPSLTYAAHATIMTGRWPEFHGVDHNHPFQPGVPVERQRWYWYARELRVPTLFELADGARMKTAAVLWPLVAGARVTWNLPEIAALPGESQTLKSLGAGSPLFQAGLELRFGKVRRGAEEPWLSEFVSLCAAHTLRSRRPRLLMTHLIALDEAKHRGGSSSPATKEALEVLDRGFGRILDAIDEAGLAKETVVAVLGDHGHIDTGRRVRLNRLLKDAGLVVGGKAWEAWFRCSGGSAFLHLREGHSSTAERARAVLAEAAAEPSFGIAQLHEGEDLVRLRCGSGAFLAVDATPGTVFLEDLAGDLIELAGSPGAFGADHGYHPDQTDYRSLFLVAGPGIGPGSGGGQAELVDVAPTLARVLGLAFAKTDGRAIERLFTK
jgi:predicted AlkP superfamily pyrophosphatase or phosphodiesterase